MLSMISQFMIILCMANMYKNIEQYTVTQPSPGPDITIGNFDAPPNYSAAVDFVDTPPGMSPEQRKNKHGQGTYTWFKSKIKMFESFIINKFYNNGERTDQQTQEVKTGQQKGTGKVRVGQVNNNYSQPGSQKKKLKKVKSSIKLQNVFRRVSQAMGKSSDSVDAASSSPITTGGTDKKAGKLFGRKLEELFNPLQDVVNMPQPIKKMLSELEEKGPNTLGIFRRGPNVRAMREVREQLDEFDPSAAPVDGESGVDIGNSCKQVDWSTISVFVTAALLKDFLRSLPDCLLQSDNYNSWIQANNNSDIKALNSCIKSLPEVNQYMLHHLLYLLYKISQNSQKNMMTSSNLSICVGPSILWTQDPQYSLDPAYTKEVSSLLETLIDNYCTLYDNI